MSTFRKAGRILVFFSVLIFCFAAVSFAQAQSTTSKNSSGVSDFIASEDTFVFKTNPNTNYGTVNILYLKNNFNTESRALVRYVVSGIPDGATINSASLGVYVSNGVRVNGSLDSAGFVAAVSGSWSAATTTWNNAPAVGAEINPLMPNSSATPGEWRNADVMSAITGNGTYDFYLLNDSPTHDDIYYASLESTQRSAGTSAAKPTLSVTWTSATSAITHGPVAGGVTDTSANIFVRSGTPGQVRVEYGTQPVYDPLTVSVSEWVTPQASQDYTAIIPVANLAPNTRYYYWVTVDAPPPDTTRSYEFTTFPPPDATQDFSFTIFSDSASQNFFAPGYATAESLNPAFVGQIGDFRHQDPGTIPLPIVIDNWWTQDKQSVGDGYAGTDFATHIGAKFPFFHIWDDHDYAKNNADGTYVNRDTFALPSFKSYFPTYPLDLTSPGLWQSFRYGKEAEVFVTDLRSQRSPNSDPDGPGKSMLGPTQKLWLENGLIAAQSAGVTWKFLISSSVWNDQSKPDDSWHLYQTEQAELINFIKDNGIANVIVISGDLHSGGGIDNGSGTISCSIGWCIPEISVPHTNIYGQNTCTGSSGCGTWSEGILEPKDPLTKISNAGFTRFTVTPASVLMQVIREDGLVNLSYTVSAR